MHRASAAYAAPGSRSSQSKISSMVAIRSQKPKRAKATCWQKVLFGRRIGAFIAAAIYILMIMQITVQMVMLVNGIEKLDRIYTFEDSSYVRNWIGTTTIRQSPLVEQVLSNHMEELNQTMYLRDQGLPSFESCGGTLTSRQQEIYSNDWLRSLYSAVVSGAAYNLTFMSSIELIAPVVDCASGSITANDTTRSKFYFLTRSRIAPEDVYIVTLALAIQEYWIHSETQVGSVAVASLAWINDLRSEHVDHHFILSLGYPYFELDFQVYDFVSSDSKNVMAFRSIPRNPTHELSKLVETTHRSGFYLKKLTEHFNLKQQRWLLEDKPMDAISRWRWNTKSFVLNTWAWVHIFDTALGVFIIGHLCQLSLVLYRSSQEGKIWAGDITVPSAKAFLVRGVVVLLFWYFTDFWELLEFCLQDAHQVTRLDTIYSFTEPMRLDVVHLVATWAGYFGKATKERIDGGIMFSMLMASFFLRASIIQISPSLVASIKEIAIQNAEQELQSSSLSPMQLRSPYEIKWYPLRLMFYVLLPIFTTIPVIMLFIIVRKIYWRFHPKLISIQRSHTPSKGTDPREAMTVLHKSAFTNFELATGAHLEAMYGMLSDYDDYVFIKGMKFASADGIYAAGFLIVNKKFLVQANDIWDILLMKLIRVRHKNLYIFKLSDTTVQQTALLVYPHTITVQDLLHLGINTLS